MVFRGDYSHASTYYGTSYRLDCVRYNGAYYIARIDAGEFSSIAPPDSTKWNAFGGSFESVATQLLLAENANIAGWIFKDGKLYSQNGLFFLNGASGEFGGIIRSSLFFSNSKVVTLNQSSYTQVEIKPEEDFAQWL